MIGTTSLSPDAGAPDREPRRTSARRKNATDGFCDVLVIVTSVSVSLPSAPDPPRDGWVWAVTRTVAPPSDCSWVRLPYCVIVACGLPIVAPQSTWSCWVESQYTLRSIT